MFLGLDQRPQLGPHAGAPSVEIVQRGRFHIMLNAWHISLACPCSSGCNLGRRFLAHAERNQCRHCVCGCRDSQKPEGDADPVSGTAFGQSAC